MDWNSIISTTKDVLTDYWLVIGIIVIVLFWASVKRYREKKAVNKKKETDKQIEEERILSDARLEKVKAEEQLKAQFSKPIVEPAPPPTPKVEEKDLGKAFMQESRDEEKKDITVNINEVSSAMKKDHEALNKETDEEFENLRTQLSEVNTRKEQIRTHGLELAELFEEYSKREQHITRMMWGLEEIMKRRKEKTE